MRTPIDLIVGKYLHQMEAERAWNDLHKLDKYIIDMAIIEKDEEGGIRIKDRDDLEGTGGKNLGALIGGVVGLTFGPAGLLGAAIGAGLGISAGAITGYFAARQVDTGLKDDTLRQLTYNLEPTSSAIVIVAAEEVGDEIVEIIGAHKADVQRYDLNFKFDEKSKFSKQKNENA